MGDRVMRGWKGGVVAAAGMQPEVRRGRKCALFRAAVFAAIVVSVFSGCSTTAREPANLYPHKQQIRAYVENGQYMRDIDLVAARAKAWVEERAARGGTNLTVVFDLDETLLFNWPQIDAMDFGYVPAAWDNWVDEAKAPAIESVREVYRSARRLGVDVVFITGRTEKNRTGTERNLRAIDCGEYAALICKSPSDQGTSAAFKTAARERLTNEGRTIIANIGDQAGDLSGGWSERTFKLPNVFYLTH
jgi:predicted secreted acid phosphatase